MKEQKNHICQRKNSYKYLLFTHRLQHTQKNWPAKVCGLKDLDGLILWLGLIQQLLNGVLHQSFVCNINGHWTVTKIILEHLCGWASACVHAMKKSQKPLWFTENEGPVRIQYKCLVRIYVFPEMKLNGLIISRTELLCSVSQFPHSCICEQFIYSQDLSAHFAAK